MNSWQFFAFLSAVFAALTAILAKLGVDEINADLATFIRTLVILALLGLIVLIGGEWRGIREVPIRGMVFLVLSGLATGASWLFYFRALKLGQASQVAPIDKLSVVLVAIFGVLFLGEHLSATHWLGVFLVGAGAVILALG